MLQRVGCCWPKFDHFQTWANNTQHIATHSKMVAKRTQHVAPNNVAICCVDMLRSLGRGFKISNSGFSIQMHKLAKSQCLIVAMESKLWTDMRFLDYYAFWWWFINWFSLIVRYSNWSFRKCVSSPTYEVVSPTSNVSSQKPSLIRNWNGSRENNIETYRRGYSTAERSSRGRRRLPHSSSKHVCISTAWLVGIEEEPTNKKRLLLEPPS